MKPRTRQTAIDERIGHVTVGAAKGSHTIGITPQDVIVGLGVAERGMLATFLALFDDSALTHRMRVQAGKSVYALTTLVDRVRAKVSRDEQSAAAEEDCNRDSREIDSRRHFWNESDYTDEQLRLLLWVRLRDALGLSARLSASDRGTRQLADDLTAALIHALDPPSLPKKSRRWLHKKGWLSKDVPAVTLEDIVVPVLDELLEATLAGHDAPSRESRRQMLIQTLTAFKRDGQEAYADQLERTGVHRTNDTAILITVLLGGSLSTFGGVVSAMGFGAYIFAAQASAFVPMVSGPGLVSFVSVLSNPITIAGIVVGGGWSVLAAARRRVEIAISSRVIALLALTGLKADKPAAVQLLGCLSRSNELHEHMGVRRKVVEAYRREWALLKPVCERSSNRPADSILRGMSRAVVKAVPDVAKADAHGLPESEREAAAVLGALSFGDALYHYAAISPTVIDAADFSRAVDITGQLNFSELARHIFSGSDASIAGSVANLKGYVAERAVAEQLVEAGHTVSFPSTPNQPGWDLLVDGQQFQVKFHDTTEGLLNHFEHYGYPVIANTELAGHLPDELTDNVFFVDGVSNELVDHVTRESLESAADMLDPAPVQLAGAITLARGLLDYRNGKVTARQALEQVLLDGSVRIGLFGAGGAIGAGVGFVVFGPAGAWVFGAGAPVLAQMQTTRMVSFIKRHAKGQTYRHWEKSAHTHLDALQDIVLDTLARKRTQLTAKMAADSGNEVLEYLNWRLTDDERFILECTARSGTLTRESWPVPEQRLTEILRCLASFGIHPFVYQNTLRRTNICMEQRPGLSELFSDAAGIPGKLREALRTERWGRNPSPRKRSSNLGKWLKVHIRCSRLR